MPANLGPDYLAAEDDFRRAATPADKISALERMWATLPKHKGTEKMQADIKRKLSQARKDSQKKGAAHAAPFYHVPREGAGQVALLGPANGGKSSLLAALTHAKPEIGDYLFTTHVPLPGMMPFEDVLIQLVDLPPLAEEFTEPWLPQVLRNAHASVLVVGLDDMNCLEEIDYIERKLEEWKLAAPALLAANKSDTPEAEDNLNVLDDLYGARYRILPVSAATRAGLDEFARAVFLLLNVVRIYTKAPGKRFEFTAPYVVKRGETVLDVARRVHKDFAEHLKFARRFRPEGGHDGLMVDRQHLVEDRDILEFHA
jgi:ribosome-interacting GTPase 1